MIKTPVSLGTPLPGNSHTQPLLCALFLFLDWFLPFRAEDLAQKLGLPLLKVGVTIGAAPRTLFNPFKVVNIQLSLEGGHAAGGEVKVHDFGFKSVRLVDQESGAISHERNNVRSNSRMFRIVICSLGIDLLQVLEHIID